MQFIADLHIHSKYSRAVSPKMVLEELDRWADDKGITVMGTGDFTHPAWMREIKERLKPAEPGLYKLKKQYKKKTIKGTEADTRFMLTVEISSIYTRGGRGRRVHNLVFVPDIKTAEQINKKLSWIGNVSSDGRPILGLDSEELVKIVFETSPQAVVIPAHAWTPWFAVFGSLSGFDSLEEAFGAYAKNIFAVETGLSSDPGMNWSVSMLDTISFISNSDAHSLEKIGREANIFDTELSYTGIIDAIKSRDPKKFIATIEFFPEEGKYHYDGHRACQISWAPEETKKHGGLCTVCGRRVTVGVMNRVAMLADRNITQTRIPFGRMYAHIKEGRVPYISLVPLDEIIGEVLSVGVKSKRVKEVYNKLMCAHTSELNVLMHTPEDELLQTTSSEIVHAIGQVRKGALDISPGYDGKFGKIHVLPQSKKHPQKK